MIIINIFTSIPVSEISFANFLLRLYAKNNMLSTADSYITLSDLYNHIATDIERDKYMSEFLSSVETLDPNNDSEYGEICDLLSLIKI